MPPPIYSPLYREKNRYFFELCIEKIHFGCIVDDKEGASLNAVKARFKVKRYARTMSVVAEFPFRNIVSVYLEVMRVYPKLGAYVQDKGYKSRFR